MESEWNKILSRLEKVELEKFEKLSVFDEICPKNYFRVKQFEYYIFHLFSHVRVIVLIRLEFVKLKHT